MEIRINFNRVDLDPIEDLIEPVIYKFMEELEEKDPEILAEDLTNRIMDTIVTYGAI